MTKELRYWQTTHMTKKAYSPEFKVHALRQALSRNGKTISKIAADLNMTTSTLKGWMKEQKTKFESAPKSLGSFTADERHCTA